MVVPDKIRVMLFLLYDKSAYGMWLDHLGLDENRMLRHEKLKIKRWSVSRVRERHA